MGQFAWCWLAVAVCVVGRGAEPVVLDGHSNVVSSVTFSQDGKRLISGSWDKTVRVWSVETGKPIRTLNGHEDWVFDVAVLKGGNVLSASQRAVRRWALPSEMVDVYGGLGGPSINALTFSADGKLIATGGRDGKVKVWQVGNPTPQAIVEGFESWVSCLAFSPNRKTLVAGTRTGHIKLFDLAQQKAGPELSGESGQQLLALAINPGGDVLASGGIDTTVRLWDLATGKESGKISGHKGVITAMAWSSDGKLIATGERHGAVKVWSYAGGNRLVTTLPGHSDNQLGFTVTALSFSPNGMLLASGSYDKSIKIWTLPDD